MKSPSILLLFKSASTSFLRFPLTILSALLGVIISIYLVEYEKEVNNMFPYINFLLTVGLGIPLFFSVAIYCNMEKIIAIKKALVYSAAFLLLIAIYYSLPTSEITNNTSLPYIRYTIYNIIIHLLVSFIPYLKTKKLNGFWNYNKTLFIRVWTSILYSGVLYLGLIFALFAVNTLFSIEFHSELYLDIYIVTAGLFNTWFFVAGIPEDLNNLENDTNYPNGLKIFTQFVLIPLLILYLIILYAYILKIVCIWDWPKGIVSYLISGVSILGILALLLIYPYSKSKENSWIQKFSRIYYFILFPLIVVLFLAIKMRIDAYGITINRYIIILLGIWLTLVSTYFSLGRKNIKFIPQSLALIMVLTSFGPWGMFTVSEKSQVNRLMLLLEDAHIIIDGKVKNEVIWIQDSLPTLHVEKLEINQHLVSDSIHNEMNSIINYLDDHHGFKSITSIFQQNIDSLITIAEKGNKHVNKNEVYMNTLGLQKYKSYNYDSNRSRENDFNFSTKNIDYTEITGYDFLIKNNYYNRNTHTKRFTIKNETYCVDPIDSFDKLMTIYTKSDQITFDLNILADRLINKFGEKTKSNLYRKELTIIRNTKTVALKIEIRNMYFEKEKDSLFLTSMKTNIFIKEK
jgi:hypothetical protein